MNELYISNKLIYETVEAACGSDILPLVEFIKNKENISETDISEKLEIPINIIRQMFYRLSDFNLVRFKKKKDKKKGWYIYYWTFLSRNISYAILALKKRRYEGLKSRITREEENIYFICNDNHFKMDFDSATEYEFKCPECGELLFQIDSQKIIDNLRVEMDELNEYIQHPPSIFKYEEEPVQTLEIITAEDELRAKKRTTKKAVKKVVKKAAKKKTVKKPAKKKVVKKVVKKPVKKKVDKKVVKKKVAKKVIKKAVKKKVIKKLVKKKSAKRPTKKKEVFSSRKKKKLVNNILKKRKKK